MGLKLKYEKGQTPLDPDEIEGLLIQSISTRSELDEFEQMNIENAVEYSMKHTFTTNKILSEELILMIHKKMFAQVWRWAGTYRKSNKNIGVDKTEIAVEVRKIIDDCKF